MHYVVGADFEPTSTLHIEVAGLLQGSAQPRRARRQPRRSAARRTTASGRVYGGELLVRQELWNNFFGWISYTLSRSERQDHPGDPWRLFQYDQTHILTILGSYKLAARLSRSACASATSPAIRTRRSSRAYYDVNSDAYVPIYGAPYSARLPAFNQLDVRVDKTFDVQRLEADALPRHPEHLQLDVGRGRRATTTTTRRRSTCNGLPFLPVLGIRGDF